MLKVQDFCLSSLKSLERWLFKGAGAIPAWGES